MVPDVDVSRPHMARIYDYFLGGKNHFAADRETAEKILQTNPAIRIAARENRAFLGRSVRYLAAEAGIRQFLDIGTGLPTTEQRARGGAGGRARVPCRLRGQRPAGPRARAGAAQLRPRGPHRLHPRRPAGAAADPRRPALYESHGVSAWTCSARPGSGESAMWGARFRAVAGSHGVDLRAAQSRRGRPADRVTLDESLSMAFLVVLESMTPAERVAFVLHDVFGYPFADVAEIVGRTPAACRKLASSARHRIRAARTPAGPRAQQADIVRDFKQAWEAKDIRALIRLLDLGRLMTADRAGLWPPCTRSSRTTTKPAVDASPT